MAPPFLFLHLQTVALAWVPLPHLQQIKCTKVEHLPQK